jgi:hypothetical protein
MPTTARPQQRYDHRLRNLVQRTGDVIVATDLGVPHSTAHGWLPYSTREVELAGQCAGIPPHPNKRTPQDPKDILRNPEHRRDLKAVASAPNARHSTKSHEPAHALVPRADHSDLDLRAGRDFFIPGGSAADASEPLDDDGDGS